MKDVVVVALDHAPVTRSCLTKTLCVSSKHSNSHQPPGGGSSLTGTHDWREIIRNMLSSSSFNKHTKQTEKSIKTDQNSTFKTMKEAKMKSVRRLFLYCGLINWTGEEFRLLGGIWTRVQKEHTASSYQEEQA